MNGPIVGERERTVVTRLRVADGSLLRPVLCRVVSMVLTRADWPLDRMEEALLVCDALCAHAPACAESERPTFSVRADESQAELCVSDLAAGGAERLLEDSSLPLVGNVLERLADSVGVERETGDRGRLTVALRAFSSS
jgi:hypothetical protein